MTKQEMKNQINSMTVKELNAFKNILEFNLRGIFIGNRNEVILKLGLVNDRLTEHYKK